MKGLLFAPIHYQVLRVVDAAHAAHPLVEEYVSSAESRLTRLVVATRRMTACGEVDSTFAASLVDAMIHRLKMAIEQVQPDRALCSKLVDWIRAANLAARQRRWSSSEQALGKSPFDPGEWSQRRLTEYDAAECDRFKHELWSLLLHAAEDELQFYESLDAF